MLYHPKGDFCINCTKARDLCNHLDFTAMRVIGGYEGNIEVKCIEYTKKV